MNIDEFLKSKKITDTDFASQIGVSVRAVGFYRKLERIPRPEIMSRIVKATQGAVTPNSFYPRADNIKESANAGNR